MMLTLSPTQIASHIGGRVRQQRIVSKLTQAEVAQTIGKSVPELEAAEIGETMLTPADIVALCYLFDVGPSWFFEGLIEQRS